MRQHQPYNTRLARRERQLRWFGSQSKVAVESTNKMQPCSSLGGLERKKLVVVMGEQGWKGYPERQCKLVLGSSPGSSKHSPGWPDGGLVTAGI